MELGDDYGMVAYGNAIAEWDARSKAFSEYVVGKTAAEVAAIETTENDHGYSRRSGRDSSRFLHHSDHRHDGCHRSGC